MSVPILVIIISIFSITVICIVIFASNKKRNKKIDPVKFAKKLEEAMLKKKKKEEFKKKRNDTRRKELRYPYFLSSKTYNKEKYDDEEFWRLDAFFDEHWNDFDKF